MTIVTPRPVHAVQDWEDATHTARARTLPLRMSMNYAETLKTALEHLTVIHSKVDDLESILRQQAHQLQRLENTLEKMNSPPNRRGWDELELNGGSHTSHLEASSDVQASRTSTAA